MTPSPGRARFAWCLFDWANSPFPTVVITFVFSAYFTQAIVGDAIEGAALWGYAMAAAAALVALLGPVAGAVADAGGPRKPWLLVCSAMTVLGALALWYATPEPSSIVWALVFVALANVGFELGMVFYNAMLPGLAEPGRLGRLSGWAWALGYAGGLVCLVIALFGLVQADPPPFGLDAAAAEPVRLVAPLAALWFVAFGWPLFVLVPDRPSSKRDFASAVGHGLGRLMAGLRDLRRDRTVLRFLIARMFFIDGLNTIFAFGGVYAAGVFGMDLGAVILFGIALNVSAGLGAFAFAWLDDAIGSKRSLVISVGGLIVGVAAAAAAPSEPWFWAAGLGLGIFIGPTQSASRSMMARLSPPGRESEMFGLFALSGRATAFAGPLLVSWATLAFDSQRAGIMTILLFLTVGLILLLPLRDPQTTAP